MKKQQQWSALNLAALIMQRLEPPHGVGIIRAHRPHCPVVGYKAHGQWALRAHGERGKVKVAIEFDVSFDWLARPPSVRVKAPFIRKEADWHVNANGTLCNILVDQWEDHFKEAKAGGSSIMELLDFAATWSLASSDSLISRHLIAARESLLKWPSDWEQWSHFQAGRDEYRRSKKQ